MTYPTKCPQPIGTSTTIVCGGPTILTYMPPNPHWWAVCRRCGHKYPTTPN